MTVTTASLADAPVTLPPVTDRRSTFAGELDRVRAELEVARRTIAERDVTIASLRTEQISDGGDSRLELFWEKAERIATAADFCSEYDRIAEAMNGPRREREYDVTLHITVAWQTTATAGEGREAGDAAVERVDLEALIEAARNGDLEVIETEVSDYQEA